LRATKATIPGTSFFETASIHMLSILSNRSFDNPTVSGFASDNGGDFFMDLVWAAANNPIKRKMAVKEFFMLKNIGNYLLMDKKLATRI
jgi:hypothetical protein